jgi:hypothetical protein
MMNIAFGEKTTDMPFGHRTQQTPHFVTEHNDQPIWPTAIVTIDKGNAPGTYVKTQRWMAPQD